MVLGLLKMKPDISFTAEYHKEYPAVDDLRDIISPKVSLENSEPYFQSHYMQVFEPRHGFIPNLSIVDLLFNQGSKATEFI
jgi:hypothetical protein